MIEQAATTRAPKQKVDYGLDAPGVQRGFRFWGLVGIVVGVTLTQLQAHRFLPTAFQYAASLTWTGACFFLQGCIFYWASKVGKLQLRDKIVRSIAWRGEEQVLDVGCGHGLMLLGAAKRLTTGHATGIDIWSQVDQADNGPEATLNNALLEGVADRVTVQSADARKLPFPNASFDVVFSSFVIHNVHSTTDREQIMREINRVLKPGGQLAIADIKHTREYANVLRSLGWINLRRWFPNFIFVTPTRVLRGTKP